MSRHSANLTSYFVTSRDEPRFKIGGYEMLLPLLGYCTDEGTAVDERQKWRNCDYQGKTFDTRRGKCSSVSFSVL